MALLVAVPAQAVFARCADLAKGLADVVPKRSDTVIDVGQDFDTVLEQGFLVFAVYEDFAPYSWEENGQAKGINIAIARMVAEEIGVQPRFQFFAADENIDADFRNQIWKGPLIGGRVANVMMHAPYDEDLQCRNEFVVLGGHYFNETLATAYRASVFPDEAPTTPYFRFHKVGVENHTISAFYLENFQNGMLLPNVVHFASHEDAFAALEAEEIDAVMGIRGILDYLDASDTNDIEVATPPLVNFALNEWTLGIAVRFTFRELYYTIDGIISDAVADGRIEQIFTDYDIAWTAPRY